MIPDQYQEEKVQGNNMVEIHSPQSTAGKGKEQIVEGRTNSRYRLQNIFGDHSCRIAGVVASQDITGKQQQQDEGQAGDQSKPLHLAVASGFLINGQQVKATKEKEKLTGKKVQ
jgi:hypothetical protein